MKKLLLLTTLALIACAPTDPEVARWEAMADEVTITRDNWGIAHVHGPTDAHAVFGMIYAQAEDDFTRVERNFLFSQGRLAEAFGEEEIWRDLRMRLFIDPVEMQAMYDESPQWLRDLMDAWADGLNYYLHTHPGVDPLVLDRFEPWMALTFSEGSIGGDIERVNVNQLRAFYDDGPGGDMAMAGLALSEPLIDWEEPRGSNGIAIAPQNTVNGNALLLINPHTSFFFRSEVHMSSDEGLNAYGAATWGQFFIYQGFNEDAGWMHTSSGVDNIDEFLETVVDRDGQYFYVVDGEERPIETQEITVPYLTDSGMAERTFTTFRTHHGLTIHYPLVGERHRVIIQIFPTGHCFEFRGGSGRSGPYGYPLNSWRSITNHNHVRSDRVSVAPGLNHPDLNRDEISPVKMFLAKSILNSPGNGLVIFHPLVAEPCFRISPDFHLSLQI